MAATTVLRVRQRRLFPRPVGYGALILRRGNVTQLTLDKGLTHDILQALNSQALILQTAGRVLRFKRMVMHSWHGCRV
jgi:hypothetical protein